METNIRSYYHYVPIFPLSITQQYLVACVALDGNVALPPNGNSNLEANLCKYYFTLHHSGDHEVRITSKICEALLVTHPSTSTNKN